MKAKERQAKNQPTSERNGTRYPSLWDRLIANCWVIEDEGEEDSCWLWLGALTPNGYPKISIRNPKTKKSETKHAHRIILQELGIKIPEGFVVDHLCENPSCINPSHLEPVTQSENLLRIYRRRNERIKNEINWGF